MSVVDSCKSAISIRDDLKQNYEVNIHMSTVKRRLAAVDFYNRLPSEREKANN